MFRSIAITLTLCLGAGTAQAALLGRAALTPGGTDYQAYYDDVLNITWLADANLAASNTFGVTGLFSDGTIIWLKAREWTAAMNASNVGLGYLGVNTWQLPEVNPMNGSSFNYPESRNGSTDRGYNQSEQGTAFAGSTGSWMAHLFYNTLDNKAFCDPLLSTVSTCSRLESGWGLSNTGPFSNLRPDYYWSGTAYAPRADYVWTFVFDSGWQGTHLMYGGYHAWAVSPGDSLAVVPVPGAVWLFGSALGLMGMMRLRAIA